MFIVSLGFPGSSADLPAMVDLGSTTGLGRSPGERNGYPLQYSCLENSMDTVHGVTNSRTDLSNFELLTMNFAQGICSLFMKQLRKLYYKML